MIDIHSHVVPLELPFGAKGDHQWPTVTLEKDRGSVEISGKVFRTVRSVSWDMSARIDEMGAVGITTQAISPMPELFSYWSPVNKALDYCAGMNDWIATKVQEHSESLVGLGIVPLQDVESACQLLQSVKAAGLAGVEIGSNVQGLSAGHARFLPFYEEADRLDLCVFVHSFHSRYEDQLPEWAVNGVTFPLESGFATEALIVNGILDAVPDGRIAVSHGGGSAAFIISRLHHLWLADEAMQERLPRSPMQYLRQLYYDSLIFSEAALLYLMQIVGWEHVCVGTDHPFFPLEAGIDPVLGIEVAEDIREALLEGNARRYLKLAGASPEVSARKSALA